MPANTEKNNILTNTSTKNSIVSKALLSKYANIIITIFLFLIITSSILIYNTIKSLEMTEATNASLSASQQSILVQKIATDVINIKQLSNKKQAGEEIAPDDVLSVVNNLKESVTTFDHTLKAFAEGGNNVGPSKIELQQVTDKVEVESIEKATKIWTAYKHLIGKFLESVENNPLNLSKLEPVVNYTDNYNANLLLTMQALEASKTAKANAINSSVTKAQKTGLFLILALFLYAIFGALRQLFLQDKKVVAIKEQSFEILSTVKEGLFLLDKNFIIAQEYSRFLESMIQQKDLAGRNFIDILTTLIPEEDLDQTTAFLKQLYNTSALEALVVDANPLNNVKVQIKKDDDSIVERYLDFNFSRVYRGSKITRILVSVFDVTDEVLKNRKQEYNNKKLEMLRKLIHVDVDLLQEFLDSTSNRTDTIRNILSDPANQADQKNQKAEDIYIEVENIKNDADHIKLESFTLASNKLEQQAHRLLDKRSLVDSDFSSLSLYLDDLSNLIMFVDNLLNQVDDDGDLSIDNLSDSSSMPKEELPQSENNTYREMEAFDDIDLNALSEEPTDIHEPKNKKVEKNQESHNGIDLDALSEQPHNSSRKEVFKGDNTEDDDAEMETDIEISELSEPFNDSNNKSNEDISAYYDDDIHIDEMHDYYVMTAEDIAKQYKKDVIIETVGFDGNIRLSPKQQKLINGINIELLSNAIVHGIESPEARKKHYKDSAGKVTFILEKSKDNLVLTVTDDGQGLNYDNIRQTALKNNAYDSKTIKAWTKKELLQLLFISGFSTASSQGEYAGSGMGMEIIKTLVTELNGRLKIGSESNLYSRFTITFPIA